MLETKLDIINIDNTGRIISVRNTTGSYDAITNPGGFGGINPTKVQVQSLIFTLSNYDQINYNKVRFVRDLDINHPEYITSNPSVSDILDGAQININSIVLGITNPEEGLSAFNDGVIDINMYTLMEDVIGVSGTKGNIYIIGTNLDQVYNSVDNIVINDDIYTINHSIPTNGGTVLYLLEPLKEDITSFIPAYRANLKVYNSKGSDCAVTNSTGKIVLDNKCNSCNKEFEDLLFKIIMWKIAAQIEFNSENYRKVDKLLKGAYRASKALNCGC